MLIGILKSEERARSEDEDERTMSLVWLRRVVLVAQGHRLYFYLLRLQFTFALASPTTTGKSNEKDKGGSYIRFIGRKQEKLHGSASSLFCEQVEVWS
jgi:hypothetical protein